MRAHYFQHVPFEGLGCITPWLEAAGYEVSCTRFFECPVLPDLKSIDLLVIMGGPMSVNDEAQYPWLLVEKQFIRDAIACGKPVLGICLGAQLIASASGAKIYPNAHREIGWFPIQAVDEGGDDCFRFPPTETVFHWHGETFDIPPGAVRIAKSEGCENQAFQLGQSVIGLQFHLETSPDSLREIIAHCRHELVPSRYVQTEAEILAVAANRFPIINPLMGRVLAFLLRHPQQTPPRPFA